MDQTLLDMLRPLSDIGVSPHVFSNFLQEIKRKKYYRNYISYLEEATFKRGQRITGASVDIIPFSAFSDPGGYAGLVPGTQFLTDVLIEYHEDLRPYFDLELKKRGGEEYHVDVSYKVGNS